MMEHLAVDIDADAPEPEGAEPGFDAFCRDAYPAMVRLAYLLTSSIETAEDLVQDVFARAYPRWSTIDEPAAYVRRAVVNACHSHHRRRFRERAHPPRPPEATALDADELFDVLAALPRACAAPSCSVTTRTSPRTTSPKSSAVHPAPCGR